MRHADFASFIDWRFARSTTDKRCDIDIVREAATPFTTSSSSSAKSLLIRRLIKQHAASTRHLCFAFALGHVTIRNLLLIFSQVVVAHSQYVYLICVYVIFVRLATFASGGSAGSGFGGSTRGVASGESHSAGHASHAELESNSEELHLALPQVLFVPLLLLLSLGLAPFD